ncbi:MAG: hypothetical protein SGPRY_007371 [Prymnesium sp.]
MTSGSLGWGRPSERRCERLRSREEPEGRQPMPARWRAYLAKHNAFVQLSAEIARQAQRAGATYIFENPVDRGMRQSPHFSWKFRDHAPLWVMPQMRELVRGKRVEWVSIPQWPRPERLRCFRGLTFEHRSHEERARGSNEAGRPKASEAAEHPVLFSATPKTEGRNALAQVQWPKGAPERPIRIHQLYNEGVYAEVQRKIEEVAGSLREAIKGDGKVVATRVESVVFKAVETQPEWARACPFTEHDPPVQQVKAGFFVTWAAKLGWPDADMIQQVTVSGFDSGAACSQDTVIFGHHQGLRECIGPAKELIDADTGEGWVSKGSIHPWTEVSSPRRVTTDDSMAVDEGDVSRNAGIADEDIGNVDLPVLRDLGRAVAIVRSASKEMGMTFPADSMGDVALWALDLSSAYRMLAVARTEWWLQQFVWADGMRREDIGFWVGEAKGVALSFESVLPRMSQISTGYDLGEKNFNGTSPPNKWAHFAFTRDDSGAYKLYINGVLQHTHQESSNMNLTQAPYWIGGQLDVGMSYDHQQEFVGSMRDVVWDVGAFRQCLVSTQSVEGSECQGASLGNTQRKLVADGMRREDIGVCSARSPSWIFSRGYRRLYWRSLSIESQNMTQRTPTGSTGGSGWRRGSKQGCRIRVISRTFI